MLTDQKNILYQGSEIELDSLVYPLFVKDGNRKREEISTMPGVYRFSTDFLIKEVEELQKLGIKNILLFGVSSIKNQGARNGYEKDNLISRSISLLKRRFPKITVISDVCLCAYTTHGHCGIIKSQKGTIIDNAKTLKILSKMALSHSEAGVDYVAPSAMAKHQVSAIRKALDKNGYTATKIIGYSAKFASHFYGPFRDAADSAPRFGDRRGYQLDYANLEAAIDEVGDDIKEGAEIVMIKPALSYLDVIQAVKKKFNYPTAAYSVSGEYSMVKIGAKLGYWQEEKIVFEIISAIRRAGANIIITYHAREIAKWLKEKKSLR